MNDIVRVTGFHKSTPEIVFVQKGKGITSSTGEKIYEEQIIEVVQATKSQLNLKLDFYIALASSSRNRYEIYMDLESTMTDSQREAVAQEIDRQLQEMNGEYESKRTSKRLNDVVVLPTASGSYDKLKRFRLEKSGIREAQFKMAYLTDDETLIDQIREKKA